MMWAPRETLMLKKKTTVKISRDDKRPVQKLPSVCMPKAGTFQYACTFLLTISRL